MNDRIKAVRKALNMKQSDFARLLGLSQTSLSMIENGKNTITDKNIKLICATFNVNERWLRAGSGEMFGASPREKEFIAIFGQLTPGTQQCLLLMAKELLKAQQELF